MPLRALVVGCRCGVVEMTVEGGTAFCQRRDHSVEKITPWGASAGAWLKRMGRRWEPFVPAVHVDEVEKFAAEAMHDPPWRVELARFLVEQWPQAARDLVRPFPNGHWKLLRFLNLGGERARQMVETNAALAYLVADGTEEELSRRLAGRRRDVAHEFGFPASEQAVRLLQKVPASAVTDALLAELREATGNDGTLHWLSQMRRVNKAIVSVGRAVRVRRQFSAPALARLARFDAPVPHLSVEARIADFAARVEAAPERARRVRGLEDIDETLWPAPAPAPAPAAPPPTPKAEKEHPRHVFPPPPVPPVDGIEPIVSADDLRREGAAQSNCIGGEPYPRRISEGWLYAYRMTTPERLTVTVQFSRGQWELSEVKAARNVDARRESVEHLRKWLRGTRAQHTPGRLPALPPPRPRIRFYAPPAPPAPPAVFGQAPPVRARRARRVAEAQLQLAFG